MEKITSVVWAACSSSLAAVAFASPTLLSGWEELKRRRGGIESRQGDINPATAARIAILFAIAFTFAMPFCSSLLAVVDDHNPIGVTGAFEGVITTGGAYNVLNHNATRQIDDIVVPGAIGKYGLKMTRYYNSRRTSNSGPMGPGWTHEYFWLRGNINFGTQFVYPNGNVWDSSCTDEWNNLPGPLGVSDWPMTWNGYPAFRLADGGTVVFENPSFGIATKIIDPYGQITNITLDGTGKITQVTEPGGRYLQFLYGTVNGLTTLMLREVDAYDGQGHLIDYVVYNYSAIKPQGNGTQGTAVNCLTSVDYSDGQNANGGTHAYYTYQDDNVPDHPYPCPCTIKIYPLVRTCQDVRYKGPMRNICYDYQDQGPHGAIIAERYSISGSTNGVQVSKIDPPAPGPLLSTVTFPTSYTEYRADSPSRTFNYTALSIVRQSGGDPDTCPNLNGWPPQQFLQSYTDFQVPAHTTYLYYDGNWYVNSVKDANGNTTTYTRGSPPPNGIGEVLSVTYPSSTGTIQYGYESPPQYPVYDPHYLTSITTARPAPSPAEVTVYTRDTNHRITETDYEEGSTVLATETFTYCDLPDAQQCSTNPLGQIKTQKLKHGAYVHYQYNTRGLLLAKTEPTWTADGPTALGTPLKTTYTYYVTEMSYTTTIPWNNRVVTVYPWADRLKSVTLAPNTSGLQASDTYEYDRLLSSYPNGITNLLGAARPGRGLVTKITHTEQAPNQNTFQQFKYDAYGNKRWEDNELRNATSYTYDEYNRLLNVTRPLNEITNYTYYPTIGGGSPYSHTTNNPDKISVRTSATTSLDTNNVYDENFRKISSTVSGRKTWFGYDNVGNQTYVTDPRGVAPGDSGYTTYTDYDARNRKWQIREPLGRTTWFEYGDNINITKIHRPDGTEEDKSYDGMNRMTSDTVPKDTGISILTQFQYYPSTGDPTDSGHSASLLSKVIDGNNNSYQFKYDAAGLKTKMIYPDSVSSQQWAYDNVHNLMSRTTVGNEVQSFTYDIRNRKLSMSWSNGADSASFTYYADNRLATASNPNSIVTRQYDAAGRLLYDQQNVIGLGTKTVNYAYYDDASLKETSSTAVNGYDFTYVYDDMRRLQNIQLTSGGNLFQYTYDNASNEIERDTVFNGVSQIYPRNALNRISTLTVLMNNPWTASEAYDYWPSGRLHTITHEYGLQDQFDYFLDGELKSASYNVGPTPTPSPTPTPTATASPGQVAEPSFNPIGGNIYPDTTVSVAITSQTSQALIRYTTDGGATWMTARNGDSTLPFEPGIAGITLTAIASKAGMTDSKPHSEYYWRQDPRGSPKTPGTVFRTVTYTLDKAGNRTNVTDNGTPIPYLPNNLNQYSQAGTYTVTNGTDHQISSYQGLNYTYINDERLSLVNGGFGFSYALAYDALGRCVKRTLNAGGPSVTTYYIYDGEKPIAEFSGTGNPLVAYNIYGKGIDEILERFYLTGGQWKVYCFQQDYEGSVTHLTDLSGNMLELYRYDAFGAPSIWGPPEQNFPQLSASAYGNRFMFTGREFSPFGFYEYRARAYHPSLGRFTSEDPKLFDAGDYNLFRYCHNDPIDMTDPMGTQDQNFAGLEPREVSRVLADEQYGKIMAVAQMNSAGGAISVAALASTMTLQLHANVMNYNEAAGLQTGAVSRGSNSISDKPQALVVNGQPVWDPYAQKWVLVPPHVSLDKNIAQAKQMSPPTWIKAVYKHGDWDYKDKGSYRDFGNINYGATGRAVGYDALTLRGMGVLYKASQLTITKQDLARDQYMIQVGIDYYNGHGY